MIFLVLDYCFGKLKYYIILLQISWNIKMGADIASLFYKYASKKKTQS
jgi:hypothetical protein